MDDALHQMRDMLFGIEFTLLGGIFVLLGTGFDQAAVSILGGVLALGGFLITARGYNPAVGSSD